MSSDTMAACVSPSCNTSARAAVGSADARDPAFLSGRAMESTQLNAQRRRRVHDPFAHFQDGFVRRLPDSTARATPTPRHPTQYS